jgi:hypothetical protein
MRRPARQKPVIRLSADGVRLVEALRARFERKLGRVPEQGDALFFDAQVDLRAPIDQSRFDAAVVAAMEAAGVDRALVYAYRRTGLLVTEQNVGACTRADLRRWQGALEEYEET